MIDFLVEDLGVGYLKMDYNINVGPGPTRRRPLPASGCWLTTGRSWSGLTRSSTAIPASPSRAAPQVACEPTTRLLSRFQLHSTSDQQDFLRYPPIAAAAPAAIAPEQAAVWAYPQPEWDDDQIAFGLCNALLDPCASFRAYRSDERRPAATGGRSYHHLQTDQAGPRDRDTVLAARAARLGGPVGGPRDAGKPRELSRCLAPGHSGNEPRADGRAGSSGPGRDGSPGCAHARRGTRWRKCFTQYSAARRSTGARRPAS